MKAIGWKRAGIVIMAIGLAIGVMSCSKPYQKIKYKTAEGYFVRNTIKDEEAYEKKFTSQDDFEAYFGAGATMNAQPTPIDFEREYVAAFIAPETNRETTITVDSLLWNGNRTEMWISMKSGEVMSYTVRPAKVLVINKEYDGEVTSFVTDYQVR